MSGFDNTTVVDPAVHLPRGEPHVPAEAGPTQLWNDLRAGCVVKADVHDTSRSAT